VPNKPSELPFGLNLAVSIVSPKSFYTFNPLSPIHHPDEVLRSGYGKLKWHVKPALRAVTLVFMFTHGAEHFL
jgi:hypothetical protein